MGSCLSTEATAVAAPANNKAPAVSTVPASTPATTTAAPVAAAPASATTATTAPAPATTAADSTTATATAAAAAAAAPKPAKADLSANGLAASDAQLVANPDWQSRHAAASQPATDSVVAQTAALLNKKGITATVVNDAKAAVDLVASLIPQNASVGFGYSTTFNEIGLNDYFKSRSDLHNFRELALAADAKGDRGQGAALRMQGLYADYFLTSANAVSAESGDILIADGTGTRAPGVMTAKKSILVISANKIVASNVAALERLEKYVLPVESARLREVYKVPGSAINNVVWVRGPNPYAPGQVHVVFIAGHSYGF